MDINDSLWGAKSIKKQIFRQIRRAENIQQFTEILKTLILRF